MDRYLLYGDIGGTKTLLHLAVVKHGEIECCYERRYDSRQYDDFDSRLEGFWHRAGRRPAVVCLAVAGPIVDQRGQVANLPWGIYASVFAEKFLIPAMKIVNDF